MISGEAMKRLGKRDENVNTVNCRSKSVQASKHKRNRLMTSRASLD